MPRPRVKINTATGKAKSVIPTNSAERIAAMSLSESVSRELCMQVILPELGRAAC